MRIRDKEGEMILLFLSYYVHSIFEESGSENLIQWQNPDLTSGILSLYYSSYCPALVIISMTLFSSFVNSMK